MQNAQKYLMYKLFFNELKHKNNDIEVNITLNRFQNRVSGGNLALYANQPE